MGIRKRKKCLYLLKSTYKWSYKNSTEKNGIKTIRMFFKSRLIMRVTLKDLAF